MNELLHKMSGNRWAFWCPGCDESHVINDGWDIMFEGILPTISPSILVQGSDEKRCHSFVRNGVIEFLGDCTHKLAGQTVPLPGWLRNGEAK